MLTKSLGQPPRTQYPEHPIPQPKKTQAQLNQFKASRIVPPANYGNPRGGIPSGMQGGTGGKESLSDLGLVPQSVLMIRFQDDAMNGEFSVLQGGSLVLRCGCERIRRLGA
jgi:tether containing UBX domain for GLUT4